MTADRLVFAVATLGVMLVSAIKVAPGMVPPRLRAVAAEATLEAAFRAGVLARKIVRRS